MKKRIFLSICVTAFSAISLISVCIVGILYRNFKIAFPHENITALSQHTIIWIILIDILVFVLFVFLAKKITDAIVTPISKLNLNEPLSNNTYEELSPLLTKTEKQLKKISRQTGELTAQQKEFDYITSNMNEGLIIFGENGTLLSANNSAKKILGYDTQHSYLQLCRDENYIHAVESALSGTSVSVKMHKDGKTYQLSANPVEGKLKSYAAVLFMIDITDKEQAERMRYEFSANVSHELKTPLTSILGCAEIIENGIAKNKDIPHFANQIHAEAARLLTLIEDIIKLSRLDEGNLKKEFQEVELSALCESVINELAEKAKAAHISVSFYGETSVINGYKPILHEMIYNLCDNAINYNKENGSITIRLTNKRNQIYLSVSDTGIGIAPENQNRIFERFYRVDKSHSKDTGGTGLGLSIVKHAAMLHGADISLESQLNIGTSITITFHI